VFIFESSNDSSNDYSYIIENRIFLPCDDRETSLKFCNLIKNISELDYFPKYDVIVRVNTSTIVNLKALNDFLISNEYDKNKLYCAQIVHDDIKMIKAKDGLWYDKDESLCHYPNGNLYIFSNEILDKLHKHIFNSYDYLTSTYDFQNDDEDKPWFWKGLSEDFLLGFTLNNHNILYDTIGDFIQIYNNNIFGSNLHDKENPLDMIALSCKTSCDYEERLKYEPTFMHLITKIIENYIISINK